MILSFLAPSIAHPVGGVAVIYEFAQSMAERGHDVHLFHHEMFGRAFTSLDEIEWYGFRTDLNHHFLGPGEVDIDLVPDGDIFFGHSDVVDANPRLGLPAVFIQGHKMVNNESERATLHAPCPKICVARWLRRVGIEAGVPADHLVYVPNGLDLDRFTLLRPIEDRTPQVTLCYNAHPRKGPTVGLEVLDQVAKARPDVKLVAFGSKAPEHTIPPSVTYHENPAQDFLVEGIYNATSVFLWPSEIEGFGLPALEAMAGGAALVSTDNGGSEDYAFAGETALLADPGDTVTLTRHVLALLENEEERVRIARAGHEHAQNFSWARSAATLEDFLLRYLDDPTTYGRPAAHASG